MTRRTSIAAALAALTLAAPATAVAADPTSSTRPTAQQPVVSPTQQRDILADHVAYARAYFKKFFGVAVGVKVIDLGWGKFITFTGSPRTSATRANPLGFVVPLFDGTLKTTFTGSSASSKAITAASRSLKVKGSSRKLQGVSRSLVRVKLTRTQVATLRKLKARSLRLKLTMTYRDATGELAGHGTVVKRYRLKTAG